MKKGIIYYNINGYFLSVHTLKMQKKKK